MVVRSLRLLAFSKTYPWDEISDSTIFDLGGGGAGGLVASVLRKHTNTKGGILDRPEVIEHAAQKFHNVDGEFSDVGARVPRENLVAGDFLKEVPPFEVYTMKWCLHNWHDSEVIQVMKNVRQAILKSQKSRFIIFEQLLKDGESARLSRYGDLIMMISTNSFERDGSQFQNLAKQTCWIIKNIYELRNAWPCAIELIPNWEVEPSSEGRQAPVAAPLTNGHANGMNGTRRSDENTPPSTAPAATELPHLANQYPSKMSFLEPWDTSSRGSPFYRSAADAGFETINFKWEEHDLTVADARPNKSSFSINTHAFEFVDSPNVVTPELLTFMRANDKEGVQRHYYPVVEQLIESRTGASRVIIFDHTVRRRRPELDEKENPNGREQPATQVSFVTISYLTYSPSLPVMLTAIQVHCDQ